MLHINILTGCIFTQVTPISRQQVTKFHQKFDWPGSIFEKTETIFEISNLEISLKNPYWINSKKLIIRKSNSIHRKFSRISDDFLYFQTDTGMNTATFTCTDGLVPAKITLYADIGEADVNG